MQRQHLFARIHGDQLEDALMASLTLDERGVDAYGLFDPQLRHLGGPIRRVPADLPLDGKIHMLGGCVDSRDPGIPSDSCDAVATRRSEEHTSELQSLMRISYAVFCLKKKTYTQKTTRNQT